MQREDFAGMVADFGNELRLWVVGERPWAQYAGSLSGRVTRRLGPQESEVPLANGCWQAALARVGATPDDEMATLVAKIGEFQLLYEVAAPNGREDRAVKGGVAAAIVW